MSSFAILLEVLLLECQWSIVGLFQLVWSRKYAIIRTGFFVINPEPKVSYQATDFFLQSHADVSGVVHLIPTPNLCDKTRRVYHRSQLMTKKSKY